MILSDVVNLSPLVSFVSPEQSGEGVKLEGITSDSRAVKPGYLFVAIKGSSSDGHDYISQALEAGAVALLCERIPSELEGDTLLLKSTNIRKALSQLAAAYYGFPSDNLAVMGVTGTNGKTTTSFLIDSLIRSKFDRCGMLGTVWVDEGTGTKPATHTTPDALSLQQSLRNMVDNGCIGVSMEISSHGIEQGRIADVKVNTAVFTNLTQDHLDYHGTMENYYQAKKALFTQIGEQDPALKSCAIINSDDTYGQRLSIELKDGYPELRQITFGFGVDADLRAMDIRQAGKGLEFRLDYGGKSYLVSSPMIGLFNVRNILCALASVVSQKLMTMREAVTAIAEARQVPGRMERVSKTNELHVFVDYAHTPDALVNACQTLKELNPDRLITVFGCGGDRDRSKRPLMAQAASENSDICIVTSDNPRTEDPISIVKQVEEGLIGDGHFTLVDRQKAILAAINFAKAGDIVLIAGKGHENYQIFGIEKVYFDDRNEARDALARKQF